MTARTWVRDLFPRTPRSVRKAPARFRPLLETLEDRLVPANLVVTSAADPATLTAGTLRCAINQANTDTAAGISDAITFNTSAMGTGLITLKQGNLDLQAGAGTTTVAGGGQVTIDSNQASGVFLIDAGATDVLSGLTIQNGKTSDNAGGIDNFGTLTLSNCTLSGNNGGFGGGIDNEATGTATLSNCTLSGNSATGGGGIYNGGTLTLSNCSLSANSATGGFGGGIDNVGTLTLSNCTLSGNIGDFGGGINNVGTLTLQSAIVAGNTGNRPDVNGNVDGGSAYNLIGYGGRHMTGISDGDANHNSVGHEPTLGQLQINGGPTQTLALSSGPGFGQGGPVTAVATGGVTSTLTTSIPVTAANAIASTPGAYLIHIDSEDMLVTGVNLSTNTLTVVRGYNGTTPAAHLANAGVFFLTDQRGYAIDPAVTTPDIGAYQHTGTAPLTPTVTRVDPANGPTTGGTSVTITGTNLQYATAVYFGGLPATIVSDSGSVIVATTPAERAGTVDTTVTTVGWDTSVTTSADQFTFIAQPPTVTTPTATAITATTATLGGDATNDGGGTITQRGVLYARTADNINLQLGGSGVNEVDDASGGTGTFTESVTGLSPDTGYSFVAFATNSVGTTYTSPATFTTLPTVQFSAAAETVLESAASFSVTVTLSGAFGQDVSVPFTLGGSAVSGTDFSGVTASPLTIKAGQTSATITGTLLADPGASPALTMTLGNPTNASLGATTVNTLTIVEPPALALPGALTAYENVAQAITGITVGASQGDSLTVTLSVGDGTLTLGKAAGVTVSGSGGSVTLAGGMNDLNAALATLTYLPTHDYSGTDALSVTVSDGSQSTSGSVAITVESPAQQAADLQARVAALQGPGGLNQGQANSLIVTLNLKGNNGDIGKVQAFLDEVQADVAAGILTQAQAAPLMYYGDILLLSVTRR
jgi:hypothetical protein